VCLLLSECAAQFLGLGPLLEAAWGPSLKRSLITLAEVAPSSLG